MKRVVLVTGAGRENIGRNISRKFATKGWTVIGCDLRFEDMDCLEGCFDDVYQADITCEDSIETVFTDIKAKYGRLDAVVNSAGTNILGSITNYKLEDFMTTVNVNMTSMFLLSREYVRQFNGDGLEKNFLGVTSDTGSFLAKSSTYAYGASKAGANAFLQCLAREMDKYHTDEWNIHALACGCVEGTPMDIRTVNDVSEQRGISKEQAKKMLFQNIPKGRGLSMEETANWVYFLITEGQYASGNVLRVDNFQQQG